MCGITGIFAFNLAGRVHMINLANATDCLRHRGPDSRGTFINDSVALGHQRLSIIDLSHHGHQPMTDISGRYTIVFNGEIYNYKELRQNLEDEGVQFQSESDTEVLLQAYIHEKEKCFARLSGFFAFAIYDKEEETICLCRDRFGIKPLYYFIDEDKFLFASELQSIIAYGLEKKINWVSLYTYLQLNYIPAPNTIFEQVHILLPGQCMKVSMAGHEITSYYQIDYVPEEAEHVHYSYEQQQIALRELLEESVRKRLIADVPVGTFLSGGVDSSIITGIAKKYKEDLHSFSVGYEDEPFFDETRYAELAARSFGTIHTVFRLKNDDLYDDLYDILDGLDQPFADSSAIPTYILSKKTREHVKVALSGDGADELFSGYDKHEALLRAMQPTTLNSFIKSLHGLWSRLPKSRDNAFSNRIRQLHRYASGLRLDPRQRYWRWAGMQGENEALTLLKPEIRARVDITAYSRLKEHYLKHIEHDLDFNEILLTDMHLVLPNDMLKKVDIMSMAHALEVRVPFLDHHVVDYVFQLPEESKILGKERKRLLRDAFSDMLPPQIYYRSKSGFEVPLLKWFRTSLRSLIQDDLLADNFVEEQGIFDVSAMRELKKKLFSLDPGDAVAQVWALIVFQWWWKKYMGTSTTRQL
jgi:asparagine synthase (glutamine-hydrolysing)